MLLKRSIVNQIKNLMNNLPQTDCIDVSLKFGTDEKQFERAIRDIYGRFLTQKEIKKNYLNNLTIMSNSASSCSILDLQQRPATAPNTAQLQTQLLQLQHHAQQLKQQQRPESIGEQEWALLSQMTANFTNGSNNMSPNTLALGGNSEELLNLAKLSTTTMPSNSSNFEAAENNFKQLHMLQNHPNNKMLTQFLTINPGGFEHQQQQQQQSSRSQTPSINLMSGGGGAGGQKQQLIKHDFLGNGNNLNQLNQQQQQQQHLQQQLHQQLQQQQQQQQNMQMNHHQQFLMNNLGNYLT